MVTAKQNKKKSGFQAMEFSRPNLNAILNMGYVQSAYFQYRVIRSFGMFADFDDDGNEEKGRMRILKAILKNVMQSATSNPSPGFLLSAVRETKTTSDQVLRSPILAHDGKFSDLKTILPLAAECDRFYAKVQRCCTVRLTKGTSFRDGLRRDGDTL